MIGVKIIIIIVSSIIALIGCIITCFTKVENINRVATIVAIISLLVTVVFSVLTYNSNQNELEECKKKNRELQEACTQKDQEIENLNKIISDQNKTISDKEATIQSLMQNRDMPKNEDISMNSDETEIKEDLVIDFADITNILYSGVEYEKYDGMSEERFTVGGNEYRVGFTIWNDGSLFSIEGSGYALFNLDQKYSKMVCNVGKMNSGDNNETLYITSSDNTIDMQVIVRSDSPSQELEIPLNYAKDLKIALDTGYSVKYGFYNIKFYK